jgi:hypothetical protein
MYANSVKHTSRQEKCRRIYRVFAQYDLKKYFRLSDRISDWRYSAYVRLRNKKFQFENSKTPRVEEIDRNPFIFFELRAEYPECFLCWLMFAYQTWSRGSLCRWILACEAGSCGGMCQSHDVWEEEI